jgi:formyl-CoA transferase
VMENTITEYTLTGYVRERSGSILPGIAPSNAYPTKGEDLVVIGANQDTLFERLAQTMGRPDLLDDPKFQGHFARGQNQAELDEIIAAWTRTKSAEEILDLMDKNAIAAGRVYRAPDMLDDPHYAARESIVEVPHPIFGTVKMQNAFPKLSETPGEVRWPGPALGEHTEAVLRDVAGLSAEAIARLRADGVV